LHIPARIRTFGENRHQAAGLRFESGLPLQSLAGNSSGFIEEFRPEFFYPRTPAAPARDARDGHRLCGGRACHPGSWTTYTYTYNLFSMAPGPVLPPVPFPPELPALLHGLNTWWRPPHSVRPTVPPFLRRQTRLLAERMGQRVPLIQVIRGPRQVGKTTAILQLVESLLADGVRPTDILLLRFDLQSLREAGGLLGLVSWYEANVRGRALDDGAPAYLLLDEIHKLRRWSEEVKHLAETARPRMVITGSSSVLVARGTRESLAGRVQTTEFPTFSFREVLEAWHPDLAPPVPPLRFLSTFDRGVPGVFRELHAFAEAHVRPLACEVATHASTPRSSSRTAGPTRVLGVDIPELFPVQQPQLLRHLYLSLARRTGQQVSQLELATEANAAGLRTNQPTVGRYMHYLADALLVREFRRFPLGKAKTARVPVKLTLTDLGVRNAIFRGAPSLFESPPDLVGSLVETAPTPPTVARRSRRSTSWPSGPMATSFRSR
jgi:predicted AAA+ superfamily ATPase